MIVNSQPTAKPNSEEALSRSLPGSLLRRWQQVYRGTPNFRGKARILNHWPARFIRNWPTNLAIVSREGCVFLHCDLNEYLYRDLFFFGLHEFDVDWMCGQILRPRDVFVDIGACYGYHALTSARRVGSQGRVYALEPQPDMFTALNENANINGMVNIKMDNLALSDRTELIQLFRFSDLGVGHTSIARLEHTVSGILTCPAITLDEYVTRNGIETVKLIKLDIEGSELKVLKGAQELLRSANPPIWILEVNMTTAEACGYHPRDLLSLLAEFGYRAYRPIWSKTSMRIRQVELCPSEAIKHGQNLLCAIPNVHAATLARVASRNQS